MTMRTKQVYSLYISSYINAFKREKAKMAWYR